MCNFDEAEYRHRFAAWCACRASSVKDYRFKVRKGKKLIEDSDLRKDLLAGWDATLLNSSKSFNEWHRNKRYRIIGISKRYSEQGNFPVFTHGIAAKLINIYMKVLFLGSVQDRMQEKNRKKQKLIHPPIDGQVLTRIANYHARVTALAGNHDVEFLSQYPTQFNGVGIPWTGLNSGQYESIIKAFMHITRYHGLWTIEEYWPGHQ